MNTHESARLTDGTDNGKSVMKLRRITMPEPTILDQKRMWETWNPEMRNPKNVNAWTTRRGETILKFLQSLNLERPKIMDFGCGTGSLSALLSELGPVTGVDLSENAIALAKEQCPTGTFIAGDLFTMPLPTDQFDVVVSQEVIAHVLDQPGYLELAARMLKSEGYIVITTPNRFVIERSDIFPPQPPEHLVRWLTVHQLKRLLRPHFQIVRSTSILPMGHQGVLRLINSTKLNSALATVIPEPRIEALKERFNFGYTLVLLAQKRR
jgi:2-polyprenyl-3-methyl-5-hydroxy-6-metoxy-1,4-benzoquinol methylase